MHIYTVKNVNCIEKHIANYQGFQVHKQIQPKLYLKLRERSVTIKSIQPDLTIVQMPQR